MWIYPVACVLNTYVFCRTMFSIQRALRKFTTVVHTSSSGNDETKTPRARTVESEKVAVAAHQRFLQEVLHKNRA